MKIRTELILLCVCILLLLAQPLSLASMPQKTCATVHPIVSESGALFHFDQENCCLHFLRASSIQYQLDSREILDQNQSATNGFGVRFINSSWYFAQRFQPKTDILTKISLLVKKHGIFPSASTFTISLRKYLHVDLKTYSIDPDVLAENASWFECNFSYIPIAVNESYYLVCHLTNASEDAFVEWLYGIGDPYIRGRPFYSIDGKEWKEYDMNNLKLDFCFQTKGILNSPPSQPQKPNGPTEGQFEKDYTYETASVDAEADSIYYLWDWGDGEHSEWLGPYDSGETCSAVHSWLIQGSYLIKVKAKDTWGFEETIWSEELTIRMKKTRSLNLFDMLFEYYN